MKNLILIYAFTILLVGCSRSQDGIEMVLPVERLVVVPELEDGNVVTTIGFMIAESGWALYPEKERRYLLHRGIGLVLTDETKYSGVEVFGLDQFYLVRVKGEFRYQEEVPTTSDWHKAIIVDELHVFKSQSPEAGTD